MFVGHGLLAFVVVAVGARRAGYAPAAAARVGLVAALFGTLPDVDILYALTGLVGIAPTLESFVESFWTTGNLVHRGVTHSLVVAAVTSAAVALLALPDRTANLGGRALFAAFVGVAFLVSGPVGALVATAFVLGALALVGVAGAADVSPRGTALAAAVGLVTHPFGDLFTGEPPAFLYPFDVALVADRVLLSADPTLHLLAAFGIELGIVWLALAAYFSLTGRRVRDHVDFRAVPGVGYAGAALVIRNPSVDLAYQFVFSVLAVGLVGLVPPPRDRLRSWRGATTALAAVTLAAGAYAVAYLYLAG